MSKKINIYDILYKEITRITKVIERREEKRKEKQKENGRKKEKQNGERK